MANRTLPIYGHSSRVHKKDIKKGNTVSLEEMMKQFKDEGLV